MGKILKMFFKNKGSIIMTVTLVLLGIGMVIAIPFVFIFALRLLGLVVEYGWGSWFGALILLSILSAGPGKKGE
jgi:hypothetical protein